MRINLHRGYLSMRWTQGQHLLPGEHDLDDALAKMLIDKGFASPLAVVEPDEPAPLEPVVQDAPDEPPEEPEVVEDRVEVEDVHLVSITSAAQKGMDLFGLTVDDFPDVDKITKATVDEFLAARVREGETETVEDE